LSAKNIKSPNRHWPILKTFPIPAKALATAVILSMAIAMTGAMGQVVVHDIGPTFFAESDSEYSGNHSMLGMAESPAAQAGDISSRGDLLSEEAIQMHEGKPSFFESEQFVWTLKWTHIHLFGMNMIFIIMGVVCLFLDLGLRARTWLAILPFAGVLIDIAAVWLKAFVSPAFFWLHLPGGGLFGVIFAYVGIRAMIEMWGSATKVPGAG